MCSTSPDVGTPPHSTGPILLPALTEETQLYFETMKWMWSYLPCIRRGKLHIYVEQLSAECNSGKDNERNQATPERECVGQHENPNPKEKPSHTASAVSSKPMEQHQVTISFFSPEGQGRRESYL